MNARLDNLEELVKSSKADQSATPIDVPNPVDTNVDGVDQEQKQPQAGDPTDASTDKTNQHQAQTQVLLLQMLKNKSFFHHLM